MTDTNHDFKILIGEMYQAVVTLLDPDVDPRVALLGMMRMLIHAGKQADSDMSQLDFIKYATRHSIVIAEMRDEVLDHMKRRIKDIESTFKDDDDMPGEDTDVPDVFNRFFEDHEWW